MESMTPAVTKMCIRDRHYTHAKSTIRESRGDKLFGAIVTIFLLCALLVTLYPLYFTVIASISDPYKVATGQIYFYPQGITLEAYQNILKESQVWVGYKNTLLYAVLGLSLIHISMCIRDRPMAPMY